MLVVEVETVPKPGDEKRPLVIVVVGVALTESEVLTEETKPVKLDVVAGEVNDGVAKSPADVLVGATTEPLVTEGDNCAADEP